MTAISRRVIVTGARNWPWPETVWTELDSVLACLQPGDTLTVVHGAAPGADQDAAIWCRKHRDHPVKVIEERHSADWATYGRAAGPRRNAQMIAAGADLVLAFPLGHSPGTRGCVAAAYRARIPVRATHDRDVVKR